MTGSVKIDLSSVEQAINEQVIADMQPPAGWKKPRVPLVGENGNAFAILGRVDDALRRAHVSQEVRERYRKAATSSDYNHLLAITLAWVEDSGCRCQREWADDEEAEALGQRSHVRVAEGVHDSMKIELSAAFGQPLAESEQIKWDLKCRLCDRPPTVIWQYPKVKIQVQMCAQCLRGNRKGWESVNGPIQVLYQR